MKTKIELTNEIMDITLKIERTFPELLKYIDEMPQRSTPPHSNAVDNVELNSYYNSLTTLFNKYAQEHSPGKILEHALPNSPGLK